MFLLFDEYIFFNLETTIFIETKVCRNWNSKLTFSFKKYSINQDNQEEQFLNFRLD